MAQANGICYVVGSMPLAEQEFPVPGPGDLLIAADGGYASLSARGITPDLVVGDFDSLGHVPDHPNLHVLPCVKDDTDMAHAVSHALTLGYTRFVLLGGIGGRLDHTVANLQLLGHIAAQGGRGILTGEGHAAAVIRSGSFSFPPSMSGYCSVFCQSGTARGVTVEGLKYTLEQATLIETVPLGVSNEFLGLPSKISVEEGTLLILWETKGADIAQISSLLAL